MGVIFAGSILFLVFSIIKNSGVYQDAMEAANSHPAVVAITGQPIEAGYLVTGEVNTSGGTGTANLSIPISGPDGSGTLHVESTKSADVWYFDRLQFVPESGGPPIDLLVEEQR